VHVVRHALCRRRVGRGAITTCQAGGLKAAQRDAAARYRQTAKYMRIAPHCGALSELCRHSGQAKWAAEIRGSQHYRPGRDARSARLTGAAADWWPTRLERLER
jgi:hypothetical protein